HPIPPIILWGCSLASVTAAGIHFAVVREHIQEYWLFGWFFAVAGVLQLWWGLRIVAQPSRSLWLAGVVGNLLLVALWSLSRTAGIPVGPDHWMPEPAGFLDTLCSVAEVLVVAGGIVF